MVLDSHLTLAERTGREGGEKLRLDQSWKKRLGGEFEKPYMADLRDFLKSEYRAGKTIYPRTDEYFAALDGTPFDKVKVVILGQDPYHGPGQAHGLCFSVQEGVTRPPSLVNIYKEIESDLGIKMSTSGSLKKWAEQGVLLLNATLTVEGGLAGSHQGKGWEQFTDRIVDLLNRERDHLVFMLWGSYAQKKGQLIDRQRHLVLTAPHPSPLSAHRGFLGCKHFSKANDYLIKHGQKHIDWQV